MRHLPSSLLDASGSTSLPLDVSPSHRTRRPPCRRPPHPPSSAMSLTAPAPATVARIFSSFSSCPGPLAVFGPPCASRASMRLQGRARRLLCRTVDHFRICPGGGGVGLASPEPPQPPPRARSGVASAALPYLRTGGGRADLL